MQVDRPTNGWLDGSMVRQVFKWTDRDPNGEILD